MRAGEALDHIESELAAAGAEGELAYGLLNRLRDEPDAWGDQVSILLGHADGDPAALVIRTGPHPALITGFVNESEIDYAAFVREMQRLDHVPTSVNGAVRCSVPFAAAWVQETGVETRTLRGLRAYELHELRTPPEITGHARTAREADRALLEPWCTAFGEDIEEPLGDGQAARAVSRFIDSDNMMLWVVDDAAVSMAAINRRTPRSSCVAWVYTPPAHRRSGYASAVVAALSQRELAAGAAWCSLFTNVSNPTSNHIYMELGYEPRCDFQHIELVAPPLTPRTQNTD